MSPSPPVSLVFREFLPCFSWKSANYADISQFLPAKSDAESWTAVAGLGIEGRLFSAGTISSPTSRDAEGEHFAITNRMPGYAAVDFVGCG